MLKYKLFHTTIITALVAGFLFGCGLLQYFESDRALEGVVLLARAKVVYDQLEVGGLEEERAAELKVELYDLMVLIVFPSEEAERTEE